jgi:hypothetical protein
MKKRYQITLGQEERAWLERESQETDRSMSAIIRRLIRGMVAEKQGRLGAEKGGSK